MSSSSISSKKFIKNLILFLILGFTSVLTTNAYTSIKTNVSNAMQVIQRTLFTSNGNQTGVMIMDINSGGKIFINPSYVVTGAANSKGVLSVNANGELIFSNVVGVTGATGPQGAMGPQGPAGSGTGSSQWLNNGSNIYYNNGNVGIGTNTPETKLDVNGTANFQTICIKGDCRNSRASGDIQASYTVELQNAYDYAYNKGITRASTIDSANVYSTYTKAELAQMISIYAENVFGRVPNQSANCEFTDISDLSLESQYYIIKSCQLGLMGINSNQFNPNDTVTKGDFGMALSRTLRGEQYNGGTPEYADHLSALQHAGIILNISNPSSLEIKGYTWLIMQRTDESEIERPSICQDPMVAIACALNPEDDLCPVECRGSNADICQDSMVIISCALNPEDESCPVECRGNNIGSGSLIVGGSGNSIFGNYSFIGGGMHNFIGGNYSFIGGGDSNTGAGDRSTVPGGFMNSANGDYSVAMGRSTVANGQNSIAIGNTAITNGQNSLAMGVGAQAHGQASISIGYGTYSSGSESTAIGFYSEAIGLMSTAIGNHPKANGNYSIALGTETIANGDYSTVIGKFNIGLSNSIFEIGIGTSNESPLNAVTVLNDGKVGIGTDTPSQTLDVNGSIRGTNYYSANNNPGITTSSTIMTPSGNKCMNIENGLIVAINDGECL